MKVSSLYRLSRPRSMAVYLYYPGIHQLAVTTWLHVDNTFPVGSILYHVLIRRSFKYIHQSDTSVMGSIGKRFVGVFSSHGGTQK